METVDGNSFYEALVRLKPVLQWAHDNWDSVDPWAVRQAFILVLEFMACHARTQGVSETRLRTFDNLAILRAQEAIPELLKKRYFE